jgi:predicted dehydrogenase
MEMKVGVGIYGINGHQVHEAFVKESSGRLVATAAFPLEKLPDAVRTDASIRHGENLDALLADPQVELVALCSPRRADQAQHAVRALRAGKHVYAEKPCAMDEAELDAILQAARESGKLFREMAGTAFEAPYCALREIVASGRLGEIVQVVAEKSYPYHDGRPQDEAIDGGLIGQCAIHGLRMVEHVAGTPIASVVAAETTRGNPKGGDLRMASSLLLQLANGGVATVNANYLNPRGTEVWGYDTLRIWGTRGLAESTQGGRQRRLVIGDEDLGSWDDTPSLDYFECYLRTILGADDMPLTLEEELRPTRWAIRAKARVIG